MTRMSGDLQPIQQPVQQPIPAQAARPVQPARPAQPAQPAVRPAQPARPLRVGPRRSRTGNPSVIMVSVDNNRCHLYAICQMEAPSVFDVGSDGRLRYVGSSPVHLGPEIRQAARLCPMQAIVVRER